MTELNVWNYKVCALIKIIIIQIADGVLKILTLGVRMYVLRLASTYWILVIFRFWIGWKFHMYITTPTSFFLKFEKGNWKRKYKADWDEIR